MSFAPFDSGVIVARLRTQVTSLRTVGLAADYAAIKNLRDFTPPSAYVVLAQERFEPAAIGMAPRGQQIPVTQRGRISIGVIVAGRNYREQAGGQLAGELRALLAATSASLNGWVPDVPGAQPLQLQRGDLLQYDDATALWCDVWQTQTIIGAVAQ